MANHPGPMELTRVDGTTVLVDVARIVSVVEVRAGEGEDRKFHCSQVNLVNGTYFDVEDDPKCILKWWKELVDLAR
jgi:hypothetical protein